jgi:Salmonella virulence plasmid 65kDa B protein
VVVCTYAKENSDGVDTWLASERHRSADDRKANRYLKRIQYGNRTSRLVDPDLTNPAWMFEVVFDYGDHNAKAPTPNDHGTWPCRDDPFSSYRAGFEVRTYRLCRRVLMFHHFDGEPKVGADCLVRSTEFAYQPGDAVGTFLTSVTARGYRHDDDGGNVVASMPPVEFTYGPATLHDEVAEIDPDSLANLPAGPAAEGHQWADLDGEGISGILAELAGAWYYKPNLGGRFGPLQQVPAIPSMAATGSTGTQLLDLAGDGQLDLVAFAGTTPGFFERTNDGCWSPFRDFGSLPTIDWGDPNLQPDPDLVGDEVHRREDLAGGQRGSRRPRSGQVDTEFLGGCWLTDFAAPLESSADPDGKP